MSSHSTSNHREGSMLTRTEWAALEPKQQQAVIQLYKYEFKYELGYDIFDQEDPTTLMNLRISHGHLENRKQFFLGYEQHAIGCNLDWVFKDTERIRQSTCRYPHFVEYAPEICAAGRGPLTVQQHWQDYVPSPLGFACLFLCFWLVSSWFVKTEAPKKKSE